MRTITSNVIPTPRYATDPLSAQDLAAVKTILDQPYRLIGKGQQCFAFVSEDNNYVIKFVRHNRFSIPPLTYITHSLPKLKAKREEIRLERAILYDETMRSHKLAWEQFRERTGLIFCHLNKSIPGYSIIPGYQPLNQKLTLIDKLGFPHTINLDAYEFTLQRKADRVPETLKSLVNTGETDRAKKMLSDLFETVRERYYKGISDRDGGFIDNFGFIDGKAVEIDTGSFLPGITVYRYYYPKEIEPQVIANPHLFPKLSLFYKAEEFRDFLSSNAPELLSTFEEEMKKIIQEKIF